MNLKNKKIGFVFTGAFYTYNKIIPKIKELRKKGFEIFPIMSFNSYNLNTRVGKSIDYINKIKDFTEKDIVHTIQDAEQIASKNLLDIIVVAPCTGNTMSKLAFNINDTPATMSIISSFKNNIPIVIAPSMYDGLGSNSISVAILLNRKNFYFVPFRQSNPITKPNAICFDIEYLIKTIEYALEFKQIQPILL